MSDPFGKSDSNKKKADGVADAINRLLQNLVLKCAKEEGIRDYFQIGVIGYGAKVGPAFVGPLAGRELVPISEIGNMPARIEERVRQTDDGAGGLIDQTIRFPIWFDPVANGGTPMCQGLQSAHAILSAWLANHPTSFPPIIMNITDGESTDGDPSNAAMNLRGLSSNDGDVLLFNLHLSSSQAPTIEFPDSDTQLPDQYAQLLFGMSSYIPSFMRSAAQQHGYNVSDGTKGFCFNADLVAVIKFLEIGTNTAGGLR